MKLTVICRNDYPEGIAYPTHADAVVERWKEKEEQAKRRGESRYDWHMRTYDFIVEFSSEDARRYVEITRGIAALDEIDVALAKSVKRMVSDAVGVLWNKLSPEEKRHLG
jgi:hypothetical protein